MNQIKQRSEIAMEDTWAIEDLYPSDEAWEAEFAKIEEDLYQAINSLGIGILGAGGETSVLAVHVEYAYTHIAGIACATSTNCMVARRASSRIDAEGNVTKMISPDWFGGR